MTNLKKELLDHISQLGEKRILCAYLWFSEISYLSVEDYFKEFILRRECACKASRKLFLANPCARVESKP